MAMSVVSQQSNAEGTYIPKTIHPGVMGLVSLCSVCIEWVSGCLGE